MKEAELRQRIYKVVARIPEGRVITYGQIAALVGSPQCARGVARALKNTPATLHIPCHRVVNSKGELAPAGVFDDQRQVLLREGVCFKENGCVDLQRSGWTGEGVRFSW